DEAIRLNPKFVVAFTSRGWAWKSKGDSDRAIADFSESINLDPKYAFAYNNRGIMLMDRRDYARAIADFSEAIRTDPGYTAAFTNRGLAYERNGDPARARTEFNAALGLPQKYGSGKWAHETARERLAALDRGAAPGQPAAAGNLPPGPPANAPGPGARLALIIGNVAYPEADPPLAQPRNDAQLIADELKNAGFQVDLVENVTKQQL